MWNMGTWYLTVFPKKIRNKTFYFYSKKKYCFFVFVLSFGHRVQFQGQKLIFWQKKIAAQNTIVSQKLSNYHISLWRKVFFSLLTNFFFINIKVAQCCEGSPIKLWTRSLIGNMVFDGFPKIIRNKTFYFYSKKNYCFFAFVLRVHFRGQKLIFWQKKSAQKTEDLLKN
jgi:hypothetical protein